MSPTTLPGTTELRASRPFPTSTTIVGVRRLVPIAFCGVLAASAAVSATASITIGYDASRPVLKVDAKGNAEVDWTERGVRKTMLVPPTGRYLPNGRISGPDVSKPAAGVTLPYLRVLRRTPDGRLWALQSWPVQANGPAELRFSRWKGEPTTASATVDGDRLTGTATFQGHGVFGFSATTAGTPIRLYAWVDCWRCQGASGWKRLIGVRLVKPNGTFSLFLKPAWQASRYRVTVPGANRGTTYAPDASVVVAT
jgi:hypothetical protein